MNGLLKQLTCRCASYFTCLCSQHVDWCWTEVVARDVGHAVVSVHIIYQQFCFFSSTAVPTLTVNMSIQCKQYTLKTHQTTTATTEEPLSSKTTRRGGLAVVMWWLNDLYSSPHRCCFRWKSAKHSWFPWQPKAKWMAGGDRLGGKTMAARHAVKHCGMRVTVTICHEATASAGRGFPAVMSLRLRDWKMVPGVWQTGQVQNESSIDVIFKILFWILFSERWAASCLRMRFVCMSHTRTQTQISRAPSFFFFPSSSAGKNVSFASTKPWRANMENQRQAWKISCLQTTA